MSVRNLLPIIVLAGVVSMTACSDKASQAEGVVTLTTPTAQATQLNAGAIAASPAGSGIVSTTVLTFSHTTPPSGGVPPLTVSWKFGDGTEAAGDTAVHVYASTGDFVAVATVTDSKGATATTSTPVSARSVTGRWTADLSAAGKDADRIVLIQNGTAVSGTINSTNNFGLGVGDGAVSNPRSLTITIKFDNPPKDSLGTPLHDPAAVTYRGDLDATLLMWAGTVTGYAGCPCPFTATRPSTN
jgi:PKD domain